MPGPKKFTYKTSLPTVRRHLTHTNRELRAQPLTQSLAAIYVDLLAGWTTTFQTDFDLQDQLDEATSEERAVDSKLNQIARRLDSTIRLISEDNTPGSLLHFYFEGKQLHAFIRPILAGQLASMRRWVKHLADSSDKTFNDIGKDLQPLIPQADAAVTKKADAAKALEAFRKLGARKTFIDEVNARRKETDVAVSALAQKHPELTPAFVQGIFRRDRSRAEDTSIEDLDEEIKELEEQLKDKKAQRAQLQKALDDEAKAKKDEDKARKKERLAQLQKEMEERQQEAAKLATEIDADDSDDDADDDGNDE